MANSTYLDTVNRILYHAGQSPIADASTFNTNSSLEKVQLQAKLFVDKVNRRLMRRHRMRFAKRQFSLSLSYASNSYSLTSGGITITVEQIVEDSMFITTSGYAGPVHHLDYYKWKLMYPEGETTQGVPTRWIDLPPEGNAYDKIAFSAPPVDSMTCIFDYYQDPVVLSTATDTIQWPSKFEDVIWDYGQLFVEIVLSEGKASDMQALMADIDSEIRQLNNGAIENPPKVDIGLSMTGLYRRARRR